MCYHRRIAPFHVNRYSAFYCATTTVIRVIEAIRSYNFSVRDSIGIARHSVYSILTPYRRCSCGHSGSSVSEILGHIYGHSVGCNVRLQVTESRQIVIRRENIRHIRSFCVSLAIEYREHSPAKHVEGLAVVNAIMITCTGELTGLGRVQPLSCCHGRPSSPLSLHHGEVGVNPLNTSSTHSTAPMLMFRCI